MAQPAGDGDRGSAIETPPLRILFLVQFLLLAATVVALVAWSGRVAGSAALGGAIALLANAYFARRVFRYRGARQAHLIASAFYRGETGKWVVSAALLAALLAGWPALSAPAVLLAFAGMYLAHSICAFWVLDSEFWSGPDRRRTDASDIDTVLIEHRTVGRRDNDYGG